MALTACASGVGSVLIYLPSQRVNTSLPSFWYAATFGWQIAIEGESLPISGSRSRQRQFLHWRRPISLEWDADTFVLDQYIKERNACVSFHTIFVSAKVRKCPIFILLRVICRFEMLAKFDRSLTRWLLMTRPQVSVCPWLFSFFFSFFYHSRQKKKKKGGGVPPCMFFFFFLSFPFLVYLSQFILSLSLFLCVRLRTPPGRRRRSEESSSSSGA